MRKENISVRSSVVLINIKSSIKDLLIIDLTLESLLKNIKALIKNIITRIIKDIRELYKNLIKEKTILNKEIKCNWVIKLLLNICCFMISNTDSNKIII